MNGTTNEKTENDDRFIINVEHLSKQLSESAVGRNVTPGGYLEVARLYKLGRWQTFVKVYLPHAIPQILVGLRLGLGGSWMAVVAAELIAATSGIGYRMSSARSNMQSDVVIVCMIVVGIVGVLMDKGIGMIFEALTPWRRIEQAQRKEG